MGLLGAYRVGGRVEAFAVGKCWFLRGDASLIEDAVRGDMKEGLVLYASASQACAAFRASSSSVSAPQKGGDAVDLLEGSSDDESDDEVVLLRGALKAERLRAAALAKEARAHAVRAGVCVDALTLAVSLKLTPHRTRGAAAAGLGVSDDAVVVEIGEALSEFWGANDEACCLGRFDDQSPLRRGKKY
mgnify:CR=1 FL=1